MPVQVHGNPISAPCRCVFMTCEVLGLDYENIFVDFTAGGTRTPEFLKVCFLSFLGIQATQAPLIF